MHYYCPFIKNILVFVLITFNCTANKFYTKLEASVKIQILFKVFSSLLLLFVVCKQSSHFLVSRQWKEDFDNQFQQITFTFVAINSRQSSFSCQLHFKFGISINIESRSSKLFLSLHSSNTFLV